MAKKGGGDTSKKAARLVQRDEATAEKERMKEEELKKEDEDKWGKGSKKVGKKEEQAAKAADRLRKKAERDELLKEEVENIPGRAEPKKSKKAPKKARGPDLSQLEGGGDDSNALPTLNASGIENALDALSVDNPSGAGASKVEKHPERRFPAALARYEELRLEEMKTDGSGDGLRLNQRKALIKKEFEKHDDNPFNQLTASYNATREDLGRIKVGNTESIEARLAADD